MGHVALATTTRQLCPTGGSRLLARRLAMVLRAFLGTFAALVVPAVALAQNPQSTPVSRPPITLRAGDVLKVRVWPDSVLSGQFTVEDNGVVVLPELGDVLIAGKDIRDIQTMLRELYGRVRKSAIVHVSPIFRVGVLGQVQRPGLSPAGPTMPGFDFIPLPPAKGDDVDPGH